MEAFILFFPENKEIAQKDLLYQKKENSPGWAN